MNDSRINKLNYLVTNDLKRKPTFIFAPENKSMRLNGNLQNINIQTDSAEWNLTTEQMKYIDDLAEKEGTIESKMLDIYQKLCFDYIYDDNTLSYIRKNDDSFYLPDEYGRKIDDTWKENRAKNNKRNCFEISRILIKSLKRLFNKTDNSNKFDICIIWDEKVTHYFVGVASDEYYLTLDLDDFTQIKDLTRMKTGLTLDGIKILEDKNSIFKDELSKINNGRKPIAKDVVEEKRKQLNDKNIINTSESEDIEFLKIAVRMLKEEYNIDSAGMFEYMKEIIDTTLGPQSRIKVWKKVETLDPINDHNKEQVIEEKGDIYTRCLIVNIEDVDYLIDVTANNIEKMFRQFNQKEFDDPNSGLVRFGDMKRDWKNEPYDGR